MSKRKRNRMKKTRITPSTRVRNEAARIIRQEYQQALKRTIKRLNRGRMPRTSNID
jgi:hypothetical protein